MLNQQLIEDDQKEVNQLPSDIRLVYGAFPHALVGLATGRGAEPLPEGFQPATIEVYHEDPDSSVLSVFNGSVNHLSPKFLMDSSMMLIEIDGFPRYICRHNRVDLDTVGGCILPDILMNPASAAAALLVLTN